MRLAAQDSVDRVASDLHGQPCLRVHRRQFVLGPSPNLAREDWLHFQVGVRVLSHCPELRVTRVRDRDGSPWALLGLAVQSVDGSAEPSVQIAAARTHEISGLYPNWAGRWLLVGALQVHLDAAGLLGCFYGRDEHGRGWVSSSPALARAVAGGEQLRADDRRLRHEEGISWFPPPRSRFPAVGRLLPSQILELDELAVEPRRLMPPIETEGDWSEGAQLVSDALLHSLSGLAGQSAEAPWLGLTAGYDSRLMLAVAAAGGIAVRPFTRIATRMSIADRMLPPRLASACGLPHAFVRGQATDRDRRRGLVTQHAAGHVSDGDAEPLLRGTRDSLVGVAFGGHGLSVASGFAPLRGLPRQPADREAAARQLTAAFGEPPRSSAADGLVEWLDWTHATPHDHLDWRDRAFIEQRQAGWLSSKEQLYDMGRLERFPLLNCARTHALLLGLDDNRRTGGGLQLELIRRLRPELARFPFNPPDRHFGLVRGVVLRSRDDPLFALRRLRAGGGRLWRRNVRWLAGS